MSPTEFVVATAAWLLAAMVHWTGMPACPADGERCVSWEKWHHEPIEAARGRYAEIAEQVAASGASAREALDLLAIAFEESGYDRLVDDGTCQSQALVREMHLPWDCDHGFARSVWQLHDRKVTAEDRTVAVKKALSLYRRAPSAWSAWKWARPLASAWWRAHPFQ